MFQKEIMTKSTTIDQMVNPESASVKKYSTITKQPPMIPVTRRSPSYFYNSVAEPLGKGKCI